MMKVWFTVLIHTLMIVTLAFATGYAAPNIDGVMSYTQDNDWGGLGDNTVTKISGEFNDSISLTNVSVEEQDAYHNTWTNNTYYDVEELGVYIEDNKLYIGIQTQFDLSDNNSDAGETYAGIYAGDFIFNFDESSSTFSDNKDADDFALDFSITGNNVDVTLLAGNLQGTASTLSSYNYGTDWEITSSTYSQEFLNAGVFTNVNTGDEDGYYNGWYTLEAAIDLSLLSDNLSSLFTTYANTYSSVTMYWQPSCGNDFLAARSEFDYIPVNSSGASAVPEPETLLLFGIGLLGAGALGRKKVIKG